MGHMCSARIQRPCPNASRGYVARRHVRHRPEETVLYDVVERHQDAFFAYLEKEGRRVPGFVREEFEAYLRCGRLEHGFVRVKCEGCKHEHLVAFSCKGRGFCPSCASRRMAETGAKWVDEILPAVPYRQWVLSFPIPLRLLFAYRPELLSTVLAVVTRGLTGDVIHRAGQRRCDAETGVVTFIQRFGSALNLNIHLHMLVPDGVWRFVNGKAHFHRTPAPDDAHIERLLARLIRRIIRCLVRAGVLVMEAEQPYLDVDTAADDGLAGLAAAAVRYRIAVGPLAGQRTMRLRVPTLTESLLPNPGALTADHEGFSLNAAVACGAHERDKLERLCRYMARGPLSNERLSVDGDGLVVHELKRPFRDGTTQCLFEPLDFLARLAALVPRPRGHLIRYHGIFAPNARHRARVMAKGHVRAPGADEEPKAARSRTAMTWMQRLRRVYDKDVSVCPRCGGSVKVLAVITEPGVIASILAHKAKREARAPPSAA